MVNRSSSVLETVAIGLGASVPCLVCMCVNILMLWTLRSRPVFLETSRFRLLYQLLLADTIQMMLSHVLFLLAYLQMRLYFPLCLLLVLIIHTSHDFSPLMLVLMSLERFVAICLPLRHSVITTTRNTIATCLGAWALTIANNLLRLGLILQTTRPSAHSQMGSPCNNLALFPGPESRLFDEVVIVTLFLVAFLSITGSYAAVIRVARSASIDQGSAGKARTTLLLHLLQLCFMIISTFHDILIMALYSALPRFIFPHIQAVLYILLIILPKCLSTLVYGVRDPTIRTVLRLYLCCKPHRQY